MIELDVQLTQDHRLVIFHDDRLNRTTDGSGRLTGCPYREIARLDAGSWFSPKFAGMKVLLASQALRLIPSPYLVNLELKRTPHPEILVPALARCLQWTRTIHRVLVSSFEASLVSRMRRTQPRVARALLCRHRPWQALRQALQLGCVALHPHRSLVTRSLVRRAHEQGLHVHVWTADRVRDVRQLIDDDVDGVVTTVVSRLRPICHAGGRPRLRAPFLTSRGRAGPRRQPREARGAWRTRKTSPRATSHDARRRRSAQPSVRPAVAAAGPAAGVAPPWRSTATTPASSRLGRGARAHATRLARGEERRSSRINA